MNEARARIKLSDREIVEHFAKLGYHVELSQLVFTTETVDDFREGRKVWHTAGSIRTNEPGLLLIEKAQPQASQKTRDVLVVSLGHARAVMGVEIRSDAAAQNPTFSRYAASMERLP